jgi:DNA-binding response OmpR family regulator
MASGPLRVLLIEDNPLEAELIRDTLAHSRQDQFVLEHATRLQAGLNRLDAGSIDVVLLDFSLPDSAGLDQGESPAHSGDHPDQPG